MDNLANYIPSGQAIAQVSPSSELRGGRGRGRMLNAECTSQMDMLVNIQHQRSSFQPREASKEAVQSSLGLSSSKYKMAPCIEKRL